MVGLFIKRYSWGAKLPKRVHTHEAHDNYLPERPVKCVIIGTTMSSPCYDLEHCKHCVRDIQTRNMYKYKLLDIRYNFLIDTQGNKYMCRGWQTIPSLPKKYRVYQRTSMYIAFIGFYDNDTPITDEMLEAKEDLIQVGVKGKFISPKFLEFNI